MTVDFTTKRKTATVVREKGGDTYTVHHMGKEIQRLGYTKVIVRSDQEEALRTVKEGVAVSLGIEVQVIPESSAVKRHETMSENAIKNGERNDQDDQGRTGNEVRNQSERGNGRVGMVSDACCGNTQ